MLQNVKKFLATSALTLSIMTVTTFAAVPPESVAFDGVSPGDTLDFAISRWGQPVWQKGRKYNFANGLTVEVQNSNRTIIDEIKSKSNRCPATANGLSVGAHEKSLNETYGQADKIKTEGVEVEYIYYTADRKKKLQVETYYDTVVEIQCELTD